MNPVRLEYVVERQFTQPARDVLTTDDGQNSVWAEQAQCRVE
jgi:hypothetical protein